MSRVADILAAVAAALDDDGKPSGLVVSTSRRRTPKVGLHIAVFPRQDEEANDNVARNRLCQGVRRLLTVGVLCRSAGSDIDNETLRSWVVSQLFRDITLGGVAVSITEGDTTWLGEIDSQSDYSEALMDIIVEYSRPRAGL